MYLGGFVVLLVATIYCQAAYFDHYDYCKIQCDYGYEKETHLKCERRNCEVDRSKCYEFEPIEISDKLKQFILDEHNKLRNKIANGEEQLGSPGPQPQAANMMALKYNDELASIAQCWANTCQPSVHSKCHRTKNLPYAGQNLASRFSTSRGIYNDIETNIKHMIFAWYEEVKLFNNQHIKPYNFIHGIGHYTLMVWGDIQEIGCGLAKFKDGKWYTIELVCNYGSTKVAGNIIDGEMYKVGKPCTACPRGMKSNPKYHALCGEDTLDLTEAKRRFANKENKIVPVHKYLGYDFESAGKNRTY